MLRKADTDSKTKTVTQPKLKSTNDHAAGDLESGKKVKATAAEKIESDKELEVAAASTPPKGTWIDTTEVMVKQEPDLATATISSPSKLKSTTSQATFSSPPSKKNMMVKTPTASPPAPTQKTMTTGGKIPSKAKQFYGKAGDANFRMRLSKKVTVYCRSLLCTHIEPC